MARSFIFGRSGRGAATRAPTERALLAAIARAALFNPLKLFADGEEGVWFDPSDFTTMFTDTGGTTNVTTFGDLVARIDDKSGNGNNATQATSGKRPTLARHPVTGARNLLTFTEDFTETPYSLRDTTLAASSETPPPGTTVVTKFVESATTAVHSMRIIGKDQVRKVHSIFAKAGETAFIQLASLATGLEFASFDLSTGTVSQLGTGMAASDASIVSVGGGFYRISAFLTPSGAKEVDLVILQNGTSGGRPSFAGDGVTGVHITGAQLETGSSATAYQAVTTKFDITETGEDDRWYLAFDGSNDALATSAIDFTGTDKMSVFAGIRKQSDATNGIVSELSADATSNNGVFSLQAPSAALGDYSALSKGTIAATATSSAIAATTTNILTLLGDISGDSLVLRVDAVQDGSSTSDQGAGNFGNHVLNIGARGGTSLQADFSMYSYIARGAASNDSELNGAEAHTARATGVNI